MELHSTECLRNGLHLPHSPAYSSQACWHACLVCVFSLPITTLFTHVLHLLSFRRFSLPWGSICSVPKCPPRWVSHLEFFNIITSTWCIYFPKQIECHFHYLDIVGVESKKSTHFSIVTNDRPYSFVTTGDAGNFSSVRHNHLLVIMRTVLYVIISIQWCSFCRTLMSF